MSDYLVDHALKNVWCTPDQDNQVIIQPARITPYNGVVSSWKVIMTSVYMPLPHVRFHLFQVGQIHPALINLFPRQDTWVKISDSCKSNKTICDIYTKKGFQLPRTETWYMVTEERNILIAVKENRKIPINFSKDEIYLRVYNNQFFSSQRSNAINDIIDIQGGTMVDTDAILALQTTYEARKLQPGGIYCFKNGYKIKDINLIQVAAGDIVEFVYDASIDKIIDFPITGLNTFDSILDNKGKYLLHYTGGIGNTIDYYDDIDLFILDGTTQRGIYYHKNNPDAIRMITHRDYSLPVATVNYFLNEHNETLDETTAFIRLHIRKSGYYRTLVNEHHRIKELYKLDDVKIQQAFIGVDATVSVWQAAQLEQSTYNTLMGSAYRGITNSLVSDAYGYNAICKLAAETVLKTSQINGQTAVQLPYFYQNNATGFEYDSNGILLGYQYHVAGTIYNCQYPTASYVEFVHGPCNLQIDEVHDQETQVLDPNYDYRFYITLKDNNAQSDTWIDVTDDPSKYFKSGNNITWLVMNEYHTLVRSNKVVLVKEHDIQTSDGLLAFNLTNLQTIGDETTERVMEVPMGELDIFLNGRSLIENLDYVVKFPSVVISNREYTDDNLVAQKVLVRFKGLCAANLSRTDANEFGFARNGRLSVDQQYDIRDDKVLRIQLNGQIKTIDDLVFNEDSGTFVFDSPINGKPYLIKDVITPLKSLTHLDTYEFRQRSRLVDDEISNYLTVKLGTPVPETLNPIIDYYRLFSPFICKIIAALIRGEIDSPILKQQYNDMQVRELVAPYLYLLDYDPIHPDNRPNTEYVIIHPHYYSQVLDLDIYHYTFVNRVIRLYANGLINLSNFARIV